MIKAVAGPEMDAAVAEYVMGWQLDVDPNSHWNGYWVDEVGKRCFADLAKFSTDIAAAWQVVEQTGLLETWVLQESVGWEVGYYESTDNGGCRLHVALEAPTAPLAICMAALREKGFRFES